MSEAKRFPYAPSNKDMSKPSSLAGGAFLGATSSIAPWLIYGKQVGVEFGIAVGGVATGALWSFESYSKGLDYAATGQKTRAYLKALESTMEAALSGAALLAPLGYHLGSIEGATVAGLGGGLITGIGSARIIIRDIPQRLREGLKNNVVEFQPREPRG